MGPIEITLIIVCSLIVVGVFGTMIYKKAKGLPTGECGCCGAKGNKLLKKYHKKYKKKESTCCCGHCQAEHVEETPKETCSCHTESKKD